MAKRKSRLNSRELKIIKSYLIKIFGNVCQMEKKVYPSNKLIIDHIDNNPLNNEESNLQLLCQSCNIKKNPPYQKLKDVDNFSLRGSGSLNEYEGEYLSTYPAIGLDQYANWKSLKSEPIFKGWLENKMHSKLMMEINIVINDGANVAECSPKTTNSYLNKLIYETGPYYVYSDPKSGIRYLKWKEEHFPYNGNIEKYMKE